MPVTPPKVVTRRAPLASNPNAVNSPVRNPPPITGSRQKRSYATLQRDDGSSQAPPVKKQIIEGHQGPRINTRLVPTNPVPLERVGSRPAANPPQTSFEVSTRGSARERADQQQVQRVESSPEQIKIWRKHYRKIFPKFVFYFESVPNDVRAKWMRYVIHLGAREVKFFSNAVTHVITTRPIPPENDVSSVSPTNVDAFDQNNALQTINPSLLHADRTRHDLLGSRTRHALDAPVTRRAPLSNVTEVHRPPQRQSDVLLRARDLGMKIWALEKLQRMLQTMFNADMDGQFNHGHNTRGHTVQNIAPETAAQPDLSQLLKHEKIHGPSDRDPTVAAKDLVIFRGPYIYIRDIDEKQRPIMVREYPQPAHKSEGEWPQFRSVAGGKCPFIDDTERIKEKEEAAREREHAKKQHDVPRTRASLAEEQRMRPPAGAIDVRALAEMDNVNRVKRPQRIQGDTKEEPPMLHKRQTSDLSSRGQNAFVSRAGTGRLCAGEPMASGLQQSAITSAIRSQMISSTAAQPGARAGTNKEMHGLQRKVLEKNNAGQNSFGMTASHHVDEKKEGPLDRLLRLQRAERRQIPENHTKPERDLRTRAAPKEQDATENAPERPTRANAKPGYCENCQDKFDDFEEHVASRKHRKFADDANNWRELDELLLRLGRELKEDF